jgi:hypothetical protein
MSRTAPRNTLEARRTLELAISRLAGAHEPITGRKYRAVDRAVDRLLAVATVEAAEATGARRLRELVRGLAKILGCAGSAEREDDDCLGECSACTALAELARLEATAAARARLLCR